MASADTLNVYLHLDFRHCDDSDIVHDRRTCKLSQLCNTLGGGTEISLDLGAKLRVVGFVERCHLLVVQPLVVLGVRQQLLRLVLERLPLLVQ
jgi:hypothetical protein